MTKNINEATVCGQVAGYNKPLDPNSVIKRVSSKPGKDGCPTCKSLEALGGHITCGFCGKKH